MNSMDELHRSSVSDEGTVAAAQIQQIKDLVKFQMSLDSMKILEFSQSMLVLKVDILA